MIEFSLAKDSSFCFQGTTVELVENNKAFLLLEDEVEGYILFTQNPPIMHEIKVSDSFSDVIYKEGLIRACLNYVSNFSSNVSLDNAAFSEFIEKFSEDFNGNIINTESFFSRRCTGGH